MVMNIPNLKVVLNPQAKRVTPAVIRDIEELIPPSSLILPTSIEENETIAQNLLREGVEAVFVGGGDGTVIAFVNALVRAAEELGIAPIPKIGLMRLGTGNAVAELVSSGSFQTDLQSFIQNPHDDTVEMPWLNAEGRLFPFGGLGLDAEVLNDYEWVKEVTENTAISPAVTNVGGYFAALFSRTIPRKLREAFIPEAVQVRVTNGRGTAHRMGADNKPEETFAPGQVMYEGPMLSGIVGSCPFYGYAMRVLPYAGMDPKRMNVRIINTPLQVILANLRPVWEGTFRHEQLFDFLAEDVLIETTQPIPYQEGGDAMGERTAVRVNLAHPPIRLIRFI